MQTREKLVQPNRVLDIKGQMTVRSYTRIARRD